MQKRDKLSPAQALARELDWEDLKSNRDGWGQVANYYGWTATIEADSGYDFNQFLDQDFACSLFWDDSREGERLNSHDEKSKLGRQEKEDSIGYEIESIDEMVERVGALYAYCSLGRNGDGVTLVITKETRWAEWGKGSKGIKQAKEYLKAISDEFRKVVDGEVYGVTVYDPNGEALDSCWGYIGHTYAQEEAASQLLYNGTYTEIKDCNGYTVRTPLSV
jgi:hypothetical protein